MSIAAVEDIVVVVGASPIKATATTALNVPAAAQLPHVAFLIRFQDSRASLCRSVRIADALDQNWSQDRTNSMTNVRETSHCVERRRVALHMKTSAEKNHKHLLVFDLNGLFVDRHRGAPYYTVRRGDEAACQSSTNDDGGDAAGKGDVANDEKESSPIARRTRNSDNHERKVAVPADFKTSKGRFHCYARKHAKEFLLWAHENFAIGVWSSATAENTAELVDRIWPTKLRRDLKFVMSQEECGQVGTMPAKSGGTKPIFIKELERVWSRFTNGEFHATNTLLIDDSEYKVVRNPAHTAIHPRPFTVEKCARDVGLSKTGALRSYLEKLRSHESVPKFVRENVFDDSTDEQIAVTRETIDKLGEELSALAVSTKATTKLLAPKPRIPKPRNRTHRSASKTNYNLNGTGRELKKDANENVQALAAK